MSYRYNIFPAILSLVFLLNSCAMGSLSQSKLKTKGAERTFEISSSGKSNIDFIDAIDVWGAKNFQHWQTVKQTVIESRGIIVFRYREPGISMFDFGAIIEDRDPERCDGVVSVEVKRKNEKTINVIFSNISQNCFTTASGVKDLIKRFETLYNQMEVAIAEF